MFYEDEITLIAKWKERVDARLPLRERREQVEETLNESEKAGTETG